jgi:hypothetical protein
MILRSAFLDPNHSTTLVLCCTAAECFSSPALPQRDFAAGAHFAQLQEGAPSREKSGKNEQEAQGIENSHDYATWAFSSVSRPHERRRPLPLDASVAAALSYSSVRSAPLSLSLFTRGRHRRLSSTLALSQLYRISI